MFLKLFLKIILINFLLISSLKSAESGGMPQLNPEFWISQVFWLIITFGFLLIVLSKLILPKISKNLERRKTQILENIPKDEQVLSHYTGEFCIVSWGSTKGPIIDAIEMLKSEGINIGFIQSLGRKT